MIYASEFFIVRDIIAAKPDPEGFLKLKHLLEASFPQADIRAVSSPLEAARQLGPQFRCLSTGIGDAYWDRIYEYLHEPSELSLDEKIRVLAYHHSSGIYAEGNTILIAPKPKYLFLAANGVLHCETAPAIAWDNGDCIYALNGHDIPPKVGKLLDKVWWTEEDINYISKTATGLARQYMLELAPRRRMSS